MEVISQFKRRKVEESPEELRSTDLKAECYGTEISELIIDRKLSGEKCPDTPKKSPRKPRKTAASVGLRNVAAKAVPADEIEDFFSTAEKYDQMRFLEKYNFDVVKDMPLEGHYQWIRL